MLAVSLEQSDAAFFLAGFHQAPVWRGSVFQFQGSSRSPGQKIQQSTEMQTDSYE
jgi:hypothetical protein